MGPAELTARLCSAFTALTEVREIKRLALYGAGTTGAAVFPLLAKNITLVADGDASKHGTEFCGHKIVSPQDLLKRAADFDGILITPVGPVAAIRSSLRNILGDVYDKKKVFSFDGVSSVEGTASGSNLLAPAPADGGLKKVRILPYDQVPARPRTTTKRRLTKRAVLYVGYPCNIKCVFCYYAYTPSKEWHTLEECTNDATLYRKKYGNEWVDITGGEPTIYPHIFELLDHCRKIDLRPSLITNTISLADADKVKKFQDHGVYDFLCSVHALTENYDMVTARKGAWKKLEQAVTNFGKVGMRWRTNCTMTSLNMRQLKRIAEFSFLNGSRAINFISYNPFYEWAQKMDIDFQARHSEIAPHLMEALDYCRKVGLEANVRYFPLCMMKGFEESAYNYPQLSYDPHEWDYCSWFSDKTRNPASKLAKHYVDMADDEEKLHLYLAAITKFVGFDCNKTCRHCAAGAICDGFANQYARRFGISEMEPYTGSLITDPTHFIVNQKKIVDE